MAIHVSERLNIWRIRTHVFWIEMGSSGDFDILKKMPMTVRRYRSPKFELGRQRRITWQDSFQCNIAMGRVRGHDEEERLVRFSSIIQESVGLGSQNVRGVFSLMTYWCILIALVAAIEILVCIRI